MRLRVDFLTGLEQTFDLCLSSWIEPHLNPIVNFFVTTDIPAKPGHMTHVAEGTAGLNVKFHLFARAAAE